MSSKKKKRAPPANAEIVREQILLLKTEKELKSSLEKIKENLNKLVIEELELKSALTRSRSGKSSTTVPKLEPVNPTYQFDSVSAINDQKLNLFSGKCSQSIEEYDEDE